MHMISVVTIQTCILEMVGLEEQGDKYSAYLEPLTSCDLDDCQA